MRMLCFFALAIGLQTSTLYAQDAEESSAEPSPALGCEQAITVFQDVSGMGRKDRAAKHMTERHAGMAEKGYRFKDMEIYTENGDLEGFFLSYTRAVACSGGSADPD